METKQIIRKVFLFCALHYAALTLFSQWTYVGGNCCLTGNNSSTTSVGDNEFAFKSNGNTVLVTYKSNFGSTPVIVMEFDGNSWTTLPDYGVNGTIASYDLEMYNDTPYVATALGGNKIRVKKYNGTEWEQLGDTIPTGGIISGFDFVMDNNGVPCVTFGTNPPKAYRFENNVWSLWVTFPVTVGPSIFSSGVVGDHTTLFDNSNLYHYVTSLLKDGVFHQLVKTYDGSNFGIAGDTVSKGNAGGRIFLHNGTVIGLYSEIFKKPYIKKLASGVWTTFGDTATLSTAQSANNAAFDASGNMYIFQSGGMENTMFKCHAASGNFMPVDSFNNTSTLTTSPQVYSLGVHPLTGNLWASFGEIVQGYNDVSVMQQNQVSAITNHINSAQVSVYPNPTKGVLHVSAAENIQRIVISDVTGKHVVEYTGNERVIDVSALQSGLYFLTAVCGKLPNRTITFSKQ